jgi:hypothetical protein
LARTPLVLPETCRSSDIAYAKLGPNPQILTPQGSLTVPILKLTRERRDRRDILEFRTES